MRRLLNSRRRPGRPMAVVLMVFVWFNNVCLAYPLAKSPTAATNWDGSMSNQPLLEAAAEGRKAPSRTASIPDESLHGPSNENYGRLPLSFEANEGQCDGRVKFLARGNEYNLFLTPAEAVFVLNKSLPRKKERLSREPSLSPARVDTAVVKMKLLGANNTPRVVGADQLPGKSNYFIGNDPTKWKTDVSNYARVRYEQVYPGVDMVYYGNQRQLEYDFIVSPGTDPRVIRQSFEGARKLRIDRNGDLLVRSDGGEMRLRKPFVYQITDAGRQEIFSRYQVHGKREISFVLGEYDENKPLVIDPSLSYSTYLGGGNGDQQANAIAVDSSGNVYVTGSTSATNFPMMNPLQGTNGGAEDVFVTKINAAGSAILYSTYIGGSAAEGGSSIAVAESGEILVTGGTSSTNFPTLNPLQANLSGSKDAFVVKLSASGNAFIYSTYLGGSGNSEGAAAVAVDSAGNAYVAGTTSSSDFPVANAYQPTLAATGYRDAFVSVINSTGTAFIYSTYLGGTDFETSYGIAVDSSGNAYVTGFSSSSNFPTTTNVFQPLKNGLYSDAFVTKFNAIGSLVYSTYLGGSLSDYASGVAVDTSGNVYIAGSTDSTDFPTSNAFQPASGGGGEYDGFIAKLDASATTLIYSTYLGGNDSDSVESIAVDSGGAAFVTGETLSRNFPLQSALQSTHGGGFRDVFVSKLDETGSVLLFSTYLGGSTEDIGYGIAVDSSGVFLAGLTGGNFPTLNPLMPHNSLHWDAFVTKIIGLTGFNITGTITGGAGGPITAATVTLSGSQSGTTQTDSNGNYSFLNLPSGGNYTVTPSKAPYTFVPTNQTFNGLSANQTADFTVATYSISGSVTGFGGAPTSGVTVVLSGTQSNTTETDANGNYSFAAVAKGGNYTVTPSKVDPILTYAFTPVSQSVSSLSANQIINFASSSTIISAMNATADAYVQDGTGANSNFGSASNLKVETDSKTNNSKNFDAYFKFDVSGVAGNITSVKLRIFASSSTAAGASTAVYSVSNTSWVESGSGSITWNNKPARSAQALAGATATVNSTTFATYDLDVTAYVKSEKSAGRDVISLALHNPSSSTVFINVNSREASANKPQLIATVGTNPNAAPSVNLTSPAVGATFTSPATITVSANATDSDGSISKVEFYAGTTLIGSTTSSPYQISWGSVAAGNYSLTAVATDNFSAATISAAVPVLVSLPNSLPSVSISSPLEGTTLSAGSNIAISANASDSNGTISKVEFFAGTTLIGTATTPSSGTLYSVTWNNVNSGAYVLTAKATDNANATTTSVAVNIKVVAQTGLSPTADAYVRDGASATTNFGTVATLQTQASAIAGNNRESYLKFDLTTVTVINKATVRLYGNLSDATGSNVPAGIYPVALTNWVESGSGSITWNTRPAAGATALATTVISDNVPRWYEFDVTAYLKNEREVLGHNLVSLAVKNTAQSSPFATFNSREAASNQPQLLLWSTQPRNALLVVGSTTLNTGDNAIKTRLQNLGFTVTAKAAGSNANSAINTSDADGKTLVLISSTVTPANVTNKFRNVTVPVLTWESGLFDYQGMTEAGFGTMNSQTDVVIINSSHPLAAGLSGTQTVAASGSFSWGTPTANAARIATLNGDATKFVIFGYDNMAAMPGLEAPARRVGLFLTDTTAASFTVNVNGGLLFDAAVKWGSELVTAPFINSLTPTSGPLGTVVIIKGGNFGAAQGTSTVAFNGVAATPTVWGYSSVTLSVPVFATTGPVVITVGGVASNAVTFAVGDSDSDGDGLPDWWELQYFGNLNQNGSGDSDGDGLTNLQEYQQGRNPTKSALADNGDFVNLKLYTPLTAP
jgi:hypothetical protein